jgi:hypothetical protein
MFRRSSAGVPPAENIEDAAFTALPLGASGSGAVNPARRLWQPSVASVAILRLPAARYVHG